MPPIRLPDPQSLHSEHSEHSIAPLVSHPLLTLNETHPVVVIAAKIKAVENSIERMFDSSNDFVGQISLRIERPYDAKEKSSCLRIRIGRRKRIIKRLEKAA